MRHCFGLFLVLLGLTAGGNTLHAQEQMVEEMKITAIRVPVRVYYQGKPVAGLTAGDFKIFEGREPQRLAGFQVITKTLDPAAGPSGEADGPADPRPRLFVLMFKITHFNDHLKEALDYLFTEILVPGDEVLVFTQYQTRSYLLREDPVPVKREVGKLLEREGQRVRQTGEQYVFKLKELVATEKYRIKTDSAYGAHNMVMFLDDYMQIWWEFKRSFLTPDVKKYINFANYLSTVRKEKWVMDFFQMQLFPQLNKASEFFREISVKFASGDDHWSRKIRDQLHEMELEFRAPVNFPADTVSEIFYNVDTTFHSFFIPSTSRIINQDLDYREITTEIETSLREITRKTGGQLVFGGEVRESIREVKGAEDVQYVLFFIPEDPRAVKKVRVEVSDPRYQLAYSSNRNPDYIEGYLQQLEEKNPVLEITRLEWSGGRLDFSISGLMAGGEPQRGMARVELTVIQSHSRETLYRSQRQVVTDAGRDRFSARVEVPDFPPGRYTLTLIVTDLNSARTARRSLQMDLPGNRRLQ